MYGDQGAVDEEVDAREVPVDAVAMWRTQERPRDERVEGGSSSDVRAGVEVRARIQRAEHRPPAFRCREVAEAGALGRGGSEGRHELERSARLVGEIGGDARAVRLQRATLHDRGTAALR